MGLGRPGKALRSREVIAALVAIVWCSMALAQNPEPASNPAPAEGTAKKKAASSEEHEKQLEERLRKMEAANQLLMQQLQTLSKQFDNLSRTMGVTPAPRPSLLDGDGQPVEALGSGTIGERPGPGAGASTSGTPDGGGAAQPGVDLPFGPGASGTIGNRPDREAVRQRARVDFGDGLEITTESKEYELKFHNLTQAEVRMFSKTGSVLHDNFFVPRERWFFLGRATKNVEFYTSINRGYGSLDLLDAFVDLIASEQFQLRAGRMKTPYTYEYWKIAEGDLIAPERSLFVGNLAPNRQIGFMGHGRLLDKRVEYAIGAFNGPRRSFQDFNNAKDFFLFVNAKPFLNEEDMPLLRQLNIGGSYNFGSQHNPLQPGELNTANDQTPNTAVDTLSPTFMKFNPNVIENGMREQWSLDLEWYYKSFNIMAGFQAGQQNYSVGSSPFQTRVPMTGFEVTAFWFVTGEQITRRVNVLEPIHSFGYRDGRWYFGALELYTRYSSVNMGRQVFSAGLVDPNLWTNQAYAFDTGLNWYLNHYTKIYLDWQHSVFGAPVVLAPGRYTSDMNLFWLRLQVFF